MSSPAAATEFVFGRYRVQPASRQLFVDGIAVKLGARAFDLLLALIERRDRVVGKNELLDLVWPKLVVEENNLQVHISALRKVLGPLALFTIPGRGYRFTATLDHVGPHPPPMPAVEVLPERADATPELKTNLPETLPPLIGRADDLAALGSLIAQHRLITITGAGGVGKSRLAQHLLAGQRNACAHGVAWVDLSGLSDPTLVSGAIADALGVQTRGDDPLQGLVGALRPLAVLVALDNAEHLVDELARVVEALLQGTPHACVLVTSQVPLKLPTERVYRLGSLAVPETALPVDQASMYGAVALFAERARAADRRFALTEQNVATVIDICRHLDGMALAIELAAARVPLLGVTQLAAALEQRLRLLTTGSRGAAPRQQTLRAELEWSHHLLSATEQMVLRRLGVFAGGFSLELAQQVVAETAVDSTLDEWAVVDALGALVDRSLVAVDAGEPPRYRLLESTRAFALELLAAAGEDTSLRRHHASAVLARFERIDAARWGGSIRVDDAVAALEPDLDNARAALAWTLAHDPPMAVALAPALGFALTRVRYLEQRRLWLATADHLTDDLPKELRAAWALGCSNFWGTRRARVSVPWARAAIDLYRRLADPVGLYRALGVLCRSNHDGAFGDLRDEVAEMRALENPAWPSHLRWLRASAEMTVARSSGAFDAALTAMQHVQTLAEQAGDSAAANAALVALADTELIAGRVDDAVRHGAALVQRLRGTRALESLAFAQLNLAGAWLAKDAVVEAREVAEAGWPLAEQFYLAHVWADYLALLAVLERRPRCCALLRGYSDGVHGGNDFIRQANEARAAERAERLAREELGDGEYGRLSSAGAALREEDVAAVAFGTRDESR